MRAGGARGRRRRGARGPPRAGGRRPASREHAYLALRAVAVLVARGPRALRRGVRRRRSRCTRRPDPFEALGERGGRAGAAAAGVPARGRRRPPLRATSRCPPPSATRSCCAQGLRRVHRRRARRRAARCSRGSRGAGRSGCRGAPGRRGAAATSTTCARRCAPRCATAASWSSAATASRAGGRGRSCWSSTSRARWRRTRGCCSSTRRLPSPPARRVEAFAFGTRLTRITRELRRPRPRPRAAPRAERVVDLGGGTRIGAALASSTACTAAGSAAARSS